MRAISLACIFITIICVLVSLGLSRTPGTTDGEDARAFALAAIGFAASAILFWLLGVLNGIHGY